MNKLLALVLGFVCVSAQAELIDHGSYTEDTATGLKWPDVTLTRGLSYDEVLSESLGPFGDFNGCRFATHTEFATLITNHGIPSQGKTCLGVGSEYCDILAPEYWELNEVLIRMLGDTEDARLDEINASSDAAPYGAGYMRAYLDSSITTGTTGYASTGYLLDGEYVSRSTGDPYGNDYDDNINSAGANAPKDTGAPDRGSLIVCDTWPPQYPQTLVNIDFEEFSAGNPAPVTSHGYSFTGWGSYGGGIFGDAWVADSAGNKYFTAEGYGDSYFYDTYASVSLSRADGGPFALYTMDVLEGPTEVIGTTSDGRLVSSNDNPVFGTGDWLSLRDAYLDTSHICISYFCDVLIAIDDVGVAETFNAEIDFDTTSITNEIQPDDAYSFTVAVLTTETADGDLYDFDATQIDLATVAFGPLGAPNTAAAQSLDIDSDGDTDVVFTFQMENTGITCLHNEVKLTGGTLGGGVFAGKDAVTRVNCAAVVDIDFDPWSTANEIAPDSLDLVAVGVKSMNTADGDAIDFDATQVNPASLEFGPAAGPVSAIPLTTDIDSDGDIDMIFGFRTEESGVICADTDVQITGETYAGQQFTGTDAVTTVECSTASCHP